MDGKAETSHRFCDHLTDLNNIADGDAGVAGRTQVHAHGDHDRTRGDRLHRIGAGQTLAFMHFFQRMNTAAKAGSHTIPPLKIEMQI